MRAWILAATMTAGLPVAVPFLAPVWAEDRALVIGQENYVDAADISGARGATQAAAALRTAGFTVVSGRDLTAEGLRALFSGLLVDLAPQDRLVIVLAGHFAQSAAQSWALGVDASLPDLGSIGGMGIDLGAVLEIAATVPGQAVVLLGTEARRLPLGPGLKGSGIGPLTIPQGVTVISGEAARVVDFAARKLPQRGVSLTRLVQGEAGLTVRGFLPQTQPFRDAAQGAAVQAPAPVNPGQTVAEKLAEDQSWSRARTAATIAGFEGYLTLYPDGRYAALAQSELGRLRNDPSTQAQLIEEALTLSRDQRRTIQRQLSLLGHDPRGIDGVFGRGSRTAIAGWQAAKGLRATGFVDRDQITRLTAEADRRAAELEAEAATRKAEQDRQDRIYWEQTGIAGDEAGLRAYLKRHPDGLYAEVATDRLAVFEADRRATAAGRDRAAWDAALTANSDAGYRRYLADFPKGAFAAEATARLEALQQDQQGGADRARAEAAEAALGLNQLARTLIERRLDGLGFNPGAADGQFDAATRRAIRRFQTSRNQPATGYLDQAAVVALLAGGIIRLGE